MADIYIDVKTTSELTRETERSVQRKIENGTYKSRKVEGVAGRGGLRYEVLLSSLPAPAQIRYLECQAVTVQGKYEISDMDMAAYRDKFGEEGLKELIERYEIVQKAIEIEERCPGRDKTRLWEQLAQRHGIGKRTLDRWISGFRSSGTVALMRKLERDSKGKRTSICLEAKRFLMERYLTKIQRKKAVVHEMLLDYAEEKGAGACINCMYREGSQARCNLELQGYMDVPACDEAEFTGIKVSHSPQTISRILKEDISPEILDYARHGRKYWEAAYMQKATREKPDIVNECWFGDHHVLDVFVVDKNGKIGKPWLTGWYDIASGCLVGWCLSMNPNSRTIAEALVYGIVEKTDFPFWGVPKIVYTDNGKDYRSHAFEGGKIVEKTYGNIQYNIETEGLLKQLHIHNIHAKAYHGWAKPIERWFGTLADRYVRELPGWCGRHPHERPEGFEKELKKLNEQGKLYTLDMIRDWLIGTVLYKYHNTEHSGYNGRKPIDIYMEKTKARYDKPSWSMLSVCKMESEERIVDSTKGIKFDNRLYWNKELRHLGKKTVKIKYNPENRNVIIVMYEGKFVCAAVEKERLKMVLEDEDKIAAHVSNQKHQEHEVRERIAMLTGMPKPAERKKSTANMLTGGVADGSDSNITVLEYEKAMKAYKDAGVAKEPAKEGKTKNRFKKTGEMILKRTANGL